MPKHQSAALGSRLGCLDDGGAEAGARIVRASDADAGEPGCQQKIAVLRLGSFWLVLPDCVLPGWAAGWVLGWAGTGRQLGQGDGQPISAPRLASESARAR